jgi:hypothetical protein
MMKEGQAAPEAAQAGSPNCLPPLPSLRRCTGASGPC